MIVELLVIKSVAIMTMYNALVMSTIDYYDNRRLQRKLHIMPLWHFINLHYRWHENTASQLLADGRKIIIFHCLPDG